MKNQRGEIGTVIAISAFVVVTVATAIASYVTNSDDASLTTTTQASESRGCQAFDASGLPAPDGFEWAKLCSKSCQQNSDCPQSRDRAVYGPNSAWCYGFSEGNRCLQLQSKGDSTPVNEDVRSSCYVGKFCNVPQCSGDKAANCSLCDGGWCNGGECATCGNARPVYDEPSSQDEGSTKQDDRDGQDEDQNEDESTGDTETGDTERDDASEASCSVLRLPEPGEIQPECNALDGDSIIFNGSIWEPQCNKECSENSQCDSNGRVGWCYGFAGGSRCAVYEGAADDSCDVKEYSSDKADKADEVELDEEDSASNDDELSDGESDPSDSSFDEDYGSGTNDTFDDGDFGEDGDFSYEEQEEQAVICSAYDVSTVTQRQTCLDNNCVVCPSRTACAASNDACPETEATDTTETCSLNITFSEVNENKPVTGVTGTITYGNEELDVDTAGSNNYFNKDMEFKVDGSFDITVSADGYQDYEDTITLIKRSGAAYCNARVALIPDEESSEKEDGGEADEVDGESCQLGVSVVDVREEPMNDVMVQVFDTKGNRLGGNRTNRSGNTRIDGISFNEKTRIVIKAAEPGYVMTYTSGTGTLEKIYYTVIPSEEKCHAVVTMRPEGSDESPQNGEDDESTETDEENAENDGNQEQSENAGSLNAVCKKRERRTGGGDERVLQTCDEGFCNTNEDPAMCREIDIDFVLRNKTEKIIKVRNISVYETGNEQNFKMHRRNFTLYRNTQLSNEKVVDVIDRFCEDNYMENPTITFKTTISYQTEDDNVKKVITLDSKRCSITKKTFVFNFN
ncbi:MAG: hypothetical protein ACOCXQ_02465 [Patescibacteria group bacterium]